MFGSKVLDIWGAYKTLILGKTLSMEIATTKITFNISRGYYKASVLTHFLLL